MKQLFPIEILESTTNVHWAKHHKRSKFIYILIVALLIITAISLPFIVVDVTSQSRGFIRTSDENNTLQTIVYAQVEKSHLNENKYVHAGDTLLWLKVEDHNEQINRLIQKQAENSQFIGDLNILTSTEKRKLSTAKYIAENSQFVAKITELEINRKQHENDYLTSKLLYEKGVESKFDHDQVKSRYESFIAQIDLSRQQQISQWQAEKTRLELENKDLATELQRTRQKENQYYVVAPVSGNIVQCASIHRGSFVIPGQTIAQIAANGSLLAECYVSPANIGYIESEQKVNLQMDAFDYQQWGLLSAIVSEISPDITQIDNKPFFKVRCLLEKDYLELTNGYRGNLKKGMTTTARFFITRRSLAQLLFDKIDNWLNPKQISNEN